MQEITGYFTNFGKEFEELYNSFASEVEGMGDELQQRGAEIIQNVVSQFEDETKEQIENSFKDAIEDVVKEMLEEVRENFTMMSIGTSVTSALSPIPTLVAAKVAMATANAILDAVDIF